MKSLGYTNQEIVEYIKGEVEKKKELKEANDE